MIYKIIIYLFLLDFIFCTYLMSSKTRPVLVGSILFAGYLFCCLFVKFYPPVFNVYFLYCAFFYIIVCIASLCSHMGGSPKVLDYFFQDILNENHIGFTRKGVALLWETHTIHTAEKIKRGEKPPLWIVIYCYLMLALLMAVNLILNTPLLVLVVYGCWYSSSLTFFFPILGLGFTTVFNLLIICYDPVWKKNFELIVAPRALHYIGFNTVSVKAIEVSNFLLGFGLVGFLILC